ncbi:MAG: hypothetical protein KatS3mg059_0026 [Thermomicrobiales bacterium]|nr:MAG: hypothetical protein KatS3mg059_0026 [Thermomicrobiales bacterium]
MAARSASLQRTGEVDIDLMLTGSGLAFRTLNWHARGRHQVPQRTIERLGLGPLEEVIVLVVPAEALKVMEALGGRLVVAVPQQVELEFGGHHGPEAAFLAARNLLPAKDGARRDRDEFTGRFVNGVGQDQRRLLVPGEEREPCANPVARAR